MSDYKGTFFCQRCESPVFVARFNRGLLTWKCVCQWISKVDLRKPSKAERKAQHSDQLA